MNLWGQLRASGLGSVPCAGHGGAGSVSQEGSCLEGGRDGSLQVSEGCRVAENLRILEVVLDRGLSAGGCSVGQSCRTASTA